MSLLAYAQSLLDCSLVGLDDAGFPPCKAFLSPSPNPAWDDCCVCRNGGEGQLWVALNNSQPRDPFRGQPCGRDFQVLYTIGLTRCTPVIHDDGSAPSAAELTAAAEKMYRDQALLLQAVTCCFTEQFDLDPEQWAIGELEIFPNQGGCQGFQLSVLVRTPNCSPC